MASAKLNTIPEEDENPTLTEIISAYGICQDCRYDFVTSRFLHLSGNDYFLCTNCFYAADHEDDYGQDFEEVTFLYQGEDGFIDPGEQDDDFRLEEDGDDDELAHAVGSESDWNREIQAMMRDGSYTLLTKMEPDWTDYWGSSKTAEPEAPATPEERRTYDLVYMIGQASIDARGGR